MLLQSLLLFFAAFLSSVGVLFIRRPSADFLQRLLVFSGSYLFSITVLHLLPELFTLHDETKYVGLYILLGFFLQLFLELFSKGVEHGHTDTVQEEAHTHSISPVSLMIALCIHAFLDGAILSSPATIHLHHHHHGASGLLLGILLHKIPVAITLSSILNNLLRRRRTVILCVAIFALASPLGLIVSSYYTQQQWLSGQGSIALQGIVSGNFLHIATTIFFESNPSHQPNLHKFTTSIMGACLAIMCEWVL